MKDNIAIGIDWARKDDETVLCLRHGCEVHFIHEPFAKWVYEKLSAPERESRAFPTVKVIYDIMDAELELIDPPGKPTGTVLGTLSMERAAARIAALYVSEGGK